MPKLVDGEAGADVIDLLLQWKAARPPNRKGVVRIRRW
jgi:hypothetical protein